MHRIRNILATSIGIQINLRILIQVANIKQKISEKRNVALKTRNLIIEWEEEEQAGISILNKDHITTFSTIFIRKCIFTERIQDPDPLPIKTMMYPNHRAA